MSIVEAIVLGLVQGLTEFIPVSSSGHLLLAHELFGNEGSSLAFDVALHVGTLLALFVFFRKDILLLARNVFAKNAEGTLARILAYATIPAVIAGLLFGDFIDDKLRSPMVVACTLAGVGVLMLYADKRGAKKNDNEVTLQQGVKIGLAQVAALIPGVSRSGATMTAGILLGLERRQAARFSFLLAIPIITGSALGIYLKDGDSLQYSTELMLGMTTAFISGVFAIKFLLGVIARSGLKPFAWYRIALAAVVFAFFV